MVCCSNSNNLANSNLPPVLCHMSDDGHQPRTTLPSFQLAVDGQSELADFFVQNRTDSLG